MGPARMTMTRHHITPSSLHRTIALAALMTLSATTLTTPPARATANNATAPGSTAQAFSIDEVLSSSFPTNLIAAPAGQRIAWIGNDQGRRNVWAADGPDWSPRRLTGYGDDDGIEMSDLAFTPDGERLVFLRGGAPNRGGELPNPTSAIDGPSRALWIVEASAGAASGPRRLGSAVRATMSSTEPRIVWADSGSAWSLWLGDGSSVSHEELSADAETKGQSPSDSTLSPERLFSVRSGLSGLRFSPDGSRLAFVSPRDGRAILGLFALNASGHDTAAGELRWLTNSADRDSRPRFSPDGTKLAFVRFPAGHEGFAICTLDMSSGVERELWRSSNDTSGGYPRAVSGSYDLMYGDGQLVFPGEWTGWNHLYTVPDNAQAGTEPRELTPGNGIVENATLSSDGGWVWVSTNTQSLGTRQLGRIRLTDGHTEWIESGGAIGWNPSPAPDDSWIAYLRADAREPASVYTRVLAEDSGRRANELPAAFPYGELVEPQGVVFRAADGVEIHGQLFLPPGVSDEADAPGVLFMHGGSRRQMFTGWHNRGYYHGVYGFNQFLASRGYVVLSVNYRSGIGYGVEFREPDDYGWRGASEYQDIIAAGRYLQTRAEVDADRIGLWGGSYGGYLTAMGLARDSELFKAGVDLHGVHDWSEQLRWYGRGEIVAPSEAERDRIAQLAFASSPVASIDTWRSPVLIVHGDDDRNVPFEASIDLVSRLRAKGDVHFEELYFIDDVHGFLRHDNWLTVFRSATDFFDRHLRPASTAASGE